jgi:hypothetical protein
LIGGVVGGVVGGGVAGGVVAGGGAAAAGGGVEDEPELLELFEPEEFVELFGGSFVVAALPPLFESVPSPEPEPSSVPEGTAGAEQPASAATPIVERASRDRATSWVAAFICRILWLRSPCSVPT